MRKKTKKKQGISLFQIPHQVVTQRGKIDRPYIIALTVLVGFGLIMVFSASMYDSAVSESKGYALFMKQLGLVGAGLFIMYILSLIDYRKFNSPQLCLLLLGITVVLLIMVWIPGIGVNVNGARRWVKLGVQFQPSEIAKVTGVLYLCMLLSRKPSVLEDGKSFFKFCVFPIGLVCGLTALEPSFSAALAIGVAMFAVLFFAGVPFKRLAVYIPVLIVAVIGLLIVEPWRIERLLVFGGAGSQDYQITQSLLAIGSGGILGKGIGNGTQKLLFLPELQNDFIFANIGEECGLWGCLLVIGLYAYIIYRGFLIAVYSKDRFASLYVSSVTALIAFQVFVNIGVAIGALPVTGMALPFVSYGGSSAMVLFAMLGPLLSISRETELKKKNKEPL